MAGPVKDERKYKTSQPTSILVSVISGTPVMKMSLNGFDTESTIDLTASTSYPNAIVDLPICEYKFTLSGAVVEIATI